MPESVEFSLRRTSITVIMAKFPGKKSYLTISITEILTEHVLNSMIDIDKSFEELFFFCDRI